MRIHHAHTALQMSRDWTSRVLMQRLCATQVIVSVHHPTSSLLLAVMLTSLFLGGNPSRQVVPVMALGEIGLFTGYMKSEFQKACAVMRRRACMRATSYLHHLHALHPVLVLMLLQVLGTRCP